MRCMATLGEVQYICNAAVSQDGHKAVVAELYELGSTLVVTIHRMYKKRSAINRNLRNVQSNTVARFRRVRASPARTLA